VFWGVQTLRQLLPASIESETRQPGPWSIAAGIIRDRPRFVWRGAMLDVARHFFGVQDVKRFIDLMAFYKLNRLHLHLTDDKGWRIEIRSWPNLATYGGSTAVTGDPGGYYTQADYAEIIEYARSRYMVVVPEIDMPGHTNAALSSYAELNCSGAAPPLFTGIEVGFSSLCVDREVTYRFVEDVLTELAAMTPGPYLHIGGDEAQATDQAEYRRFIERIQLIVLAQGKRMVGWEEIAQATLDPTSIAQHWASDMAVRAVQQGSQVILSPAARAYLDMQYDPSSPLGLHWAGYVEVRDAYDWDPAALLEGVREQDVLGVEAPLWSETLRTIEDVEYMAFPRLIGIAEIGWSAAEDRSWEEYRARLAAHGPRLTAMDVPFYRSPQVDWR
jgi:hexosaminidase